VHKNALITPQNQEVVEYTLFFPETIQESIIDIKFK